MNTKKAKKIRRQLKKMGYNKEDFKTTLQLSGKTKTFAYQVAARQILGKPVGTDMKTEFREIPILELKNEYKRKFKELCKK